MDRQIDTGTEDLLVRWSGDVKGEDHRDAGRAYVDRRAPVFGKTGVAGA